MATTVYTAIIEKEEDLYAALCPELDVASQGATVEEATSNLREAPRPAPDHLPGDASTTPTRVSPAYARY